MRNLSLKQAHPHFSREPLAVCESENQLQVVTLEQKGKKSEETGKTRERGKRLLFLKGIITLDFTVDK